MINCGTNLNSAAKNISKSHNAIAKSLISHERPILVNFHQVFWLSRKILCRVNFDLRFGFNDPKYITMLFKISKSHVNPILANRAKNLNWLVNSDTDSAASNTLGYIGGHSVTKPVFVYLWLLQVKLPMV